MERRSLSLVELRGTLIEESFYGHCLISCIFQTGSGKTFTITGGAERYIDRGIIPRTLSYIFEYFRLAVERRSPSLVVLRGTLIEESFHGHCLISCIFQTGSGKTFTITGGAERYIDRGIIPRTLSYIFEYFRLAVERRSPSLVVLRGTLIEESFHAHCLIFLNILRTILYILQTGSGKTFTITGGAERYIDRGIIPRTLSYIFEYFEKVSLSLALRL